MKKRKVIPLVVFGFSSLVLGASSVNASPDGTKSARDGRAGERVGTSAIPNLKGEAGTSEEIQRYEARQESSKDLEEFRGGSAVVAVAALVFILILVAIILPW